MGARRSIVSSVAILAACFALYVAGDVMRSVYGANRYKQRLKRIAPNKVRVDNLRLLPKRPGIFRLRAQVHNSSPTYTLDEVSLDVIVDDCVNGDCRQVAKGSADLFGRALPNQSATFFAEELILPELPQPLGERRLTSRIAYTRAAR